MSFGLRALSWLAMAAVAVGLFLPARPRAAESREELIRRLRNDPSLSREERIRLHKKVLQQLIEERRKRQRELEEKRKKELEERIKQQRAKALEAMRKRALAARRATGTGLSAAPSAPGARIPYRVARAILFLSPFNVITGVGQEFKTDVRIYSADRLPFDEIVVGLKYDPLVLTPVEVNDAPIYERLAGEPKLETNSSKGLLRYRARLGEPMAATSTTLLTVRWRALNPILHSEIAFLESPEETRICKNGRDILGYVTAGQRKGGLLPGTVAVVPRNDSPRTLMPPLSEVVLNNVDERVHLLLEAEPEQVEAGREWIVSLVLRNDAMLPFNDLCVRVLFDPEKLRVLDWHRGNWIRQGINIYDGFAHDRFPFDIHLENRADNERGEIVYHVASQTAQCFPSGELARIKFKALAEASLADVRFDFELAKEAAGGEPLTDVRLFGSSLFYWRQERKESAERPAPEPLRRPGT